MPKLTIIEAYTGEPVASREGQSILIGKTISSGKITERHTQRRLKGKQIPPKVFTADEVDAIRKADKMETENALKGVKEAVAAAKSETRATADAMLENAVKSLMAMANRMGGELEKTHLANLRKSAAKVAMLSNKLAAAKKAGKATKEQLAEFKAERDTAQKNTTAAEREVRQEFQRLRRVKE
jgi:hypothetical protein